MPKHSEISEPSNIHEEKHAHDAAFGTVLQFQGDGTGESVPAQLGQDEVVMVSALQGLSVAEAAAAYLKFSGTLTGASVAVVPDTWGPAFVTNACTGAFGLSLSTSGGTGVSVAVGKTRGLLANGVDVIALTAEL
jgi:hypothetical protein